MSGLTRTPTNERDRTARQARLEETAQLVGRLAHDFGNILTGILGFSELSLSLLSPNSPAYQYATELHRAAQQGADFTHALRWFSRRARAGDVSSSAAEAIIQETARLREECPATISIQVNVPGDLLPVAVGGEALRQVLRQLLDNARDAVSGGGTIRLLAGSVELREPDCEHLFGDAQAGEFVEVRIADSGDGFSASARERLLVEPFFSTKPRRRGLGLAVVYGILRCHQGGFAIDEGPDGGTEVRLYFPAAGRPAAVVTSAAPPESDRILVVDDDPMVLQLVCATLRQAGFQVQPAPGGAEALACYESAGSAGFRLVLADVLMPRVNGIELARQLLLRDAQVNLLFMSGQGLDEFAQADFLSGRFELLSKPFRPEGLLRAVRHALERRSPAAPAPTGRPAAVSYSATS